MACLSNKYSTLYWSLLSIFWATHIASAESIQITSGLTDYRVYQRDADNVANIPLAGTCDFKGSGAVQARLSDIRSVVNSFDWQQVGTFSNKRWKGELKNVPTGGPYTIELRLVSDKKTIRATKTVSNILVGDLWILAGQSNMQGVGDLQAAESPDIRVSMFGYDEQWTIASDPLHWLLDSVDPVHQLGLTGEALIAARNSARRNAVVGAGLGLPFAKEMIAQTGVPIGLIPCAHGGTSMTQWDPERRDEGGKSLYGSMYRRFKAIGGNVTGVLWYQGEADANKNASYQFHERFVKFVKAVRTDFDNPELPFYYVQIGRFVYNDNQYWNVVQDQQRVCAEEIPYCRVAASVDLELDDPIHIGTPGLKRLGKRLAALALRDIFDRLEIEIGPQFSKITPVIFRQPRYRIQFTGINEHLKSDMRVGGFSIRDSTGACLNLIFKAEITGDGQAIDLFMRSQPAMDSYLWYGYGMNPYCNVVDARDMALPMFGPIPMSELDYWSLFEAARKQPQHPDNAAILSYVQPYISLHPEKRAELLDIVNSVVSSLKSEQQTRYYPILFSLGDFSKWKTWLEKARATTNIAERQQMASAWRNAQSTRDLKCDFVKEWHVVGPFDNANDAGFDHAYAPEQNAVLTAIYTDGLHKPLNWKLASTNSAGYLNFLNLFDPNENVVAYAQVAVHSRESASIPMLLGSDDAAVVWVNGKEVHREHRHRSARPAQDLIIGDLQRGRNLILIKVDQLAGDWGLYLQFVDKDGLLSME
ncbi:sialate O-acetylesterase [candidate division KSB1 bacterium]|nr:sialate O-acetylesterase [candidate division KSB1 bacterium]